jgi:hypothetical protein
MVELYYVISIYGNTMNILMERVHWICFVTDTFRQEITSI